MGSFQLVQLITSPSSFKMTVNTFLYGCSLLLCSCNHAITQNIAFDINHNTYSLSLPDSSGMSIAGFAVDLDRMEYLRTIQSSPQRIECYSLEDGSLKKVVHVKTAEIAGVLKYGEDFLVFDNDTRHLMHLDVNGQVLDTYAELEELPVPELAPVYTSWTNVPMVRLGDSVFFAATLAAGSSFDHRHPMFMKLGVVRVFDLHKKKFSWLGQISPGNQTEDYGFGHRYTVAVGKGELVISPGFSNELMRVSLSDGSNSIVENKKSDHDRLLTPFRTWKENQSTNYIASEAEANAMIEHFRITPSFVNIIYDPFRDRFYRILIIPQTIERPGEMRIAIYDETLNYIGECSIPNHYTTTGAFVSEKGLNLINRQEYQMDQSVLVFDSFVVTK